MGTVETDNKGEIETVASLAISGLSINAIANELKISRYMVQKIKNSDEFKQKLEEIKEQAMSESINTWKSTMRELTPKAIKLLHKLFDENNPRALDYYLKTIGIEKEQVQQQSSNIQVVLPSFITDQGKVIDIEKDSNE